MKKIWILFVTFISIAMAMLLFFDTDDWAIHTKDKELDIPMNTVQTLNSLARDIKIKIPQIGSETSIGKVEWTVPCKKMSAYDGLLTITFCRPLPFQRYKLYDITVDLSASKIVRLRIYGNRQIGCYDPIPLEFMETSVLQYANEITLHQSIQQNIQQYINHGILRMEILNAYKRVDILPYSGATVVYSEQF